MQQTEAHGAGAAGDSVLLPLVNDAKRLIDYYCTRRLIFSGRILSLNSMVHVLLQWAKEVPASSKRVRNTILQHPNRARIYKIQQTPSQRM